MMDLRPLGKLPDEERFGLSYVPEPMSGCWLWLGRPRGSNGYGCIKVDGKPTPAHRYSWVLHKGEIGDGLLVLHKCDTPLCVNPEHLFLGTHADNQADKVRKGRQARGERLVAAQAPYRARGVRNGNSRLNPEKIATIRHDSRPQRVIAADYGVSQTAIWQIKNGRTWR